MNDRYKTWKDIKGIKGRLTNLNYKFIHGTLFTIFFSTCFVYLWSFCDSKNAFAKIAVV